MRGTTLGPESLMGLARVALGVEPCMNLEDDGQYLEVANESSSARTSLWHTDCCPPGASHSASARFLSPSSTSIAMGAVLAKVADTA